MSKPKKQNFLQGAALLAAATAIVKIIGALYKLPLNAIIGEQGFSYFYTAYEIYAVLMMVSTAGLPVAMSRMISAANSLGHYRQVRQIYRTAQTIFLTLGLVSSALMMIFCRQLADFVEQPDSWFAIACLGPSALLVCMMSSYRGFFQGQENMIPTSISQVLEAFFKLVVGIAAAIFLLKTTASISLSAGGAILGVTVSCLIATLYLFTKFRREYAQLPVSDDRPEPFFTTAKRLLAIAVPITIGSAGLQLLSVLESKVYMSRLMGIGYSQTEADVMKGIYNMAQTIFLLPCGFITPINISIIPAITAHLTLNDKPGAKATEESAARIAGLISLPCAVGLLLLGEPVMALLGGYEGERLELATILMALHGISVFFYSLAQFTNAVLQAHNRASLPVVNMLLAGTMRVVVDYMLTGNPAIGMVGVPIAGVLCHSGITFLNLFSMRRVIPDGPKVMKNALRALLPAAVMGGAVFGVYMLIRQVTDSALIGCALPIAVGVVVYVLAVALFKTVRREDCLLLPKGETIAKLLRL